MLTVVLLRHAVATHYLPCHALQNTRAPWCGRCRPEPLHPKLQSQSAFSAQCTTQAAALWVPQVPPQDCMREPDHPARGSAAPPRRPRRHLGQLPAHPRRSPVRARRAPRAVDASGPAATPARRLGRRGRCNVVQARPPARKRDEHQGELAKAPRGEQKAGGPGGRGPSRRVGLVSVYLPGSRQRWRGELNVSCQVRPVYCLTGHLARHLGIGRPLHGLAPTARSVHGVRDRNRRDGCAAE